MRVRVVGAGVIGLSCAIRLREAGVDALAAEGFASVIRLPLRNPQALALARSQLDEITASPAPLLLFLDRLEDLALAFQASLLVRVAPPAVADAFCAGRFGEARGRVYGTLPAGVDAEAIIARALGV